MSTPRTGPFHQAQHPPTDTVRGIAPLAELITHRRRGLHRANDHDVRVEAILGNGGYLAFDVTQIGCTGQDPRIQGLLSPTATIQPGPGAP